MLGQEDLECVKLLRYALDVVQAVDSDDELDTLKLPLQRGNALLDFRLLQAFPKLLWVDADRECANGHNLALKLDAVWCCCETTASWLATQPEVEALRDWPTVFENSC